MHKGRAAHKNPIGPISQEKIAEEVLANSSESREVLFICQFEAV